LRHAPLSRKNSSPSRLDSGDERISFICVVNRFTRAGSSGELPGWFHFGFFVESAAACQGLYERMQREQVPIVRPLVSEPFTNYFCADPDGHLVQVYFDPRAA
jgi:catechol-2,3-dioxygenase